MAAVATLVAETISSDGVGGMMEAAADKAFIGDDGEERATAASVRQRWQQWWQQQQSAAEMAAARWRRRRSGPCLGGVA